jgi:tRNA(Ile)-lysidine synthase
MSGRGPAVDDTALLARCSFPPSGTSVDCAYSGGADSTALLVLALGAGCLVRAVHVDHGLRPESAAEAAAAGALAARLGVSCEVVPVDVALGANLEARARDARHAALPAGALTGHTADDRAETMLINLLRGTGVDGLTALGPAPTRPILTLRRTETRAVCAGHGLEPVHDRSNDDGRFVRNRVRAELLPLMADIAGRDVVSLLERMATVLADDAELAAGAAAGIDATDARALAAASPALARRAIRAWLLGTLPAGYPPDRASVERVLQVALGDHLACELSGGIRVERHHQRLRVVAPRQVVSTGGMEQAGDGGTG